MSEQSEKKSAENWAPAAIASGGSFLSIFGGLTIALFAIGYFLVVSSKSAIPFAQIPLSKPEFIICGAVFVVFALAYCALPALIFIELNDNLNTSTDNILESPSKLSERANPYISIWAAIIANINYAVFGGLLSAMFAHFPALLFGAAEISKLNITFSVVFFSGILLFIANQFIDKLKARSLYKQHYRAVFFIAISTTGVIVILLLAPELSAALVKIPSIIAFALFSSQVVRETFYIYKESGQVGGESAAHFFQILLYSVTFILIILLYGKSILPSIDSKFNPFAEREVTVQMYKIYNFPHGKRAKNLTATMVLAGDTDYYFRDGDTVFSLPRKEVFSVLIKDTPHAEGGSQ